MPRELLLEHASGLYEEASIDRFVGDLHLLVIRISPLQPPRDLLGGPLAHKLLCYCLTEPRPVRQLAMFWSTRPIPGRLVRPGGTVDTPASITPHLPADRRRRPVKLTALLPSVSEGETLQVRLLTASAVVLGMGLATGMVIEVLDHGVILEFSHKILLSLLSFALIVALLIVHRVTGLAGRRAARYLLVAYLLLTLGYPGVKFVTDVIIA